MPTTPVIRIHCRRASAGNLSKPARTGVLISGDDVNILRLLSVRDVLVGLECEGTIIYQASARALLQATHYLADQQLWYVPATLTGPLKRPLPHAVDE